jgi:hypothetical protein
MESILNQTSYDKETAEALLKQFDNDYMKVIRYYYEITDKVSEPKQSINQEIYKQIREKINLTKTNSYKQSSPANENP